MFQSGFESIIVDEIRKPLNRVAHYIIMIVCNASKTYIDINLASNVPSVIVETTALVVGSFTTN
jgi:hypothetical protein